MRSGSVNYINLRSISALILIFMIFHMYKTTSFRYFIAVACLLLCSVLSAQSILSPDKTLTAELLVDVSLNGFGRPKLLVYKNMESTRDTVNAVVLGIQTKNKDLAHHMKIVSVGSLKSIVEKYEMISGKRRFCENEGNERTFVLQNQEGNDLAISIRVFNDGVAFRYGIDNGVTDTVLQEYTSYAISEGHMKWMQR